MSFRYLPHTADLRAEVTAEDGPAVYQAAADLVRDIVVGAGEVEPRGERVIALEGDEQEALFRFIRELLYLIDTEEFLPATVQLSPPDTGATEEIHGGWTARVRGERFDPRKHETQHQVKAVTRHAFRYSQDGSGRRAEVVFDL